MQVSLRELVILVSVGSLFAAALVRPGSAAELLIFSFTLLMLLGAILLAVVNWNSRREFCRAFAIAGGAYLFFAHLPDEQGCSPRGFGPELTTQSIEWCYGKMHGVDFGSVFDDPEPFGLDLDMCSRDLGAIKSALDRQNRSFAHCRSFFRISHCLWALYVGWIAGHVMTAMARRNRRDEQRTGKLELEPHRVLSTKSNRSLARLISNRFVRIAFVAAWLSAMLALPSRVAATAFFSGTLLAILTAILLAVSNLRRNREFLAGFALAACAYLAIACRTPFGNDLLHKRNALPTTRLIQQAYIRIHGFEHANYYCDLFVRPYHEEGPEQPHRRIPQTIISNEPHHHLRSFFRIGQCAWALLFGWITGHALLFNTRSGRAVPPTEHSPNQERPALK